MRALLMTIAIVGAVGAYAQQPALFGGSRWVERNDGATPYWECSWTDGNVSDVVVTYRASPAAMVAIGVAAPDVADGPISAFVIQYLGVDNSGMSLDFRSFALAEDEKRRFRSELQQARARKSLHPRADAVVSTSPYFRGRFFRETSNRIRLPPAPTLWNLPETLCGDGPFVLGLRADGTNVVGSGVLRSR